MPRVPRLDRQQVQQALYQPNRVNPNAPIETFGGGQATARPDLSGVRQIANEIATQERDKANQIAVLDADTKLATLRNTLLYDQDSGLVNKRGKDAFGEPDRIRQVWDTSTAEIANGLSNDDQKLAFQHHLAARTTELDATVQQHVAGDRRTYDDETTKGAVSLERDNGVRNFGDPTKIAFSIAHQQAVLTDYANRNGMPKEWLDNAKLDAASATHVGVIDQLLAAKQGLGAKSYFEANKGEIAAVHQDEVKRRVDVAANVAGGISTSSDIWERLGPKAPDAPVLVETMENEARRMVAEPEQLQVVMNDLRQRTEAHRDQQKATFTDNASKVYGQVNSGATISQIQQMPEYLALPGHEQATVIRHMKDEAYTLHRRAFTEAREDAMYARSERREAQDAKFAELSDAQTLWAMTPDQIRAQQGALGTAYTNQLVTRRQKMSRLSQGSIDDDLFRTSAVSAGIEVNGKLTKTQQARVGRLRSAVEEAIGVEQQSEEGELSRDRKAKIMQDVIDQKVTVDGGWFSSNKELPAAVLTDDERGHAYVPAEKIPKPDRTSIENLFRSKGKRVVPRNVERAYAAYLLRDKKLLDSILAE